MSTFFFMDPWTRRNHLFQNTPVITKSSEKLPVIVMNRRSVGWPQVRGAPSTLPSSNNAAREQSKIAGNLRTNHQQTIIESESVGLGGTEKGFVGASRANFVEFCCSRCTACVMLAMGVVSGWLSQVESLTPTVITFAMVCLLFCDGSCKMLVFIACWCRSFLLRCRLRRSLPWIDNVAVQRL